MTVPVIVGVILVLIATLMAFKVKRKRWWDD